MSFKTYTNQTKLLKRIESKPEFIQNNILNKFSKSGFININSFGGWNDCENLRSDRVKVTT